jgi:hypothetical protein
MAALPLLIRVIAAITLTVIVLLISVVTLRLGLLLRYTRCAFRVDCVGAWSNLYNGGIRETSCHPASNDNQRNFFCYLFSTMNSYATIQ